MGLKLITTEQFNGLDCNFYRNGNDDILITREQIGSALKYSNPQKAIDNIHAKHRDRLDQFSVTLKLRGMTGQEYPTMLYTTKGVMEICRWSRQPKADEFMDFTWEVMDRIFKGDTINKNGSVNNQQQELFNQQMQKFLINAQQQLTALTTLIAASLPKPYKPLYTRWMGNIYAKVDIIAESLNLTRKQMLHKLYTELQDTYDIDLNEYRYEYCYTHNLEDTGLYTMNAIESNLQLKQLFQLIVDHYIEQQPTDTYNILNQTHAG